MTLMTIRPVISVRKGRKRGDARIELECRFYWKINQACVAFEAVAVLYERVVLRGRETSGSVKGREKIRGERKLLLYESQMKCD